MAKLGHDNWVVNPSIKQQKGAALLLLYAGTPSACTLLEIQVRCSVDSATVQPLVRHGQRIWDVVHCFPTNPVRSAGSWCLPSSQMHLWLLAGSTLNSDHTGWHATGKEHLNGGCGEGP